MSPIDRYHENARSSKSGPGGLRWRRLAAGCTTALISAAIVFAIAPPRALAQDIAMPVKGVYDTQSSFYQSGVTASDINSDGQKELLVGNQNGLLYCFDSRANILWKCLLDGPVQGTPACCDVDADGNKEVWIGSMTGKVWGFDCEGKVLSKWGWPKSVKKTGGLNGVFSSPAVGDITGDGNPEIVVGTYGQFIYAWDYRGWLQPGWPYNNEDTVWSSPALADLDWDGVEEVVIGADSTGGSGWPYPPGGLLYALEGDTSVLTGFPKVTPEVTWSSPTVADIDGDGRYEILVGTGHYYTSTGKLTTEGHRVYAYNHDGSAVKGWPSGVAGCTFSSPALGDVNGDGSREVAIGTASVGANGEDSLTVISSGGKVLLTKKGNGGPMMGSPALGDLNADGRPDIIIGAGQRICAWQGDGTELWRQELDNFLVGDPAVGDFDGDGRVEVAVTTGDAPGGAFKGGKLYVFDCGPGLAAAPSGDRELFPWPMFRCDSRHSATILTGEEPEPPQPAPAKTWYLPEGSTAGGMETWILVQNPLHPDASVRVTYMTPSGPVEGPRLKLSPGTRCTINVADAVPNAWEVSTKVVSDKPVIVERAMYGNNRTWGHDSIGATAPKQTWYLAEGSTGEGMETWVLVQNPNRKTATVALNYMTPKGIVRGPGAEIRANSRKTFFVADTVNHQWSVSTQVTSDLPVIVERAMYGNNRTWGHDSIGYAP